MQEHKVYKFHGDGEVLIYIPDLAKLMIVSEAKAHRIPGKVKGSSGNKKKSMQVDKRIREFPPKFASVRLHLTNRCNLNCSYCCADSNKTGETLSIEQVKVAVKYLLENAASKHVEINYFGRGEPTVAWDLIPASVFYALDEAKRRNLEILFSITSNGLWSAEQNDFIAKYFRHVELSLDGPACVHNSHRPIGAGKDSFKTVFQAAKNIHREKDINLWLSTVISSQSVHQMTEIVEYFCREFPGVRLHLDPLEKVGEKVALSEIDAPDMGDFLNNYFKCLRVVERMGSGNQVTTSVISLNPSNATDFCQCNGENFIVAPSGKVGSCERIYPHNHKGLDAFIFGKVGSREIVFDREKYERLALFDAGHIKKCTHCFAIYFCRGGCPYSKISLADKFWTVPSPYCKEIQEAALNYLWYTARRGENRPGSIRH